MSIINRVLQDLDRRQGTSDPDATLAMSQVRTVQPARKEREWFWRIIALLMIVALGWVGWIAWQLQPREPVVTEQAFRAAENARRPLAAAPAPAPSTSAPEQKPAAPSVPAEKPAPQPASDALKLAQGIERPIREPVKPAPKEAPKPVAKEPVKAPVQETAAPKAEPAGPTPPPVAQGAPRVEKRDRVRSPEDRAEGEFRRGVALLNQGRVAEAEDALHAALASHSGHEAARQAMVALHLEQGRIDEARRLLQEGVALNPANTRFAAVLARILIERKDYAAALDAIAGVRAEQGDAELQAMRGTALQRLGRHGEASDAFQASLRVAPQNGSAWMALGISLEAQGKRPEAAEAFKRAASASGLSVQARDYAEQRARALQ